MEKDCGYKWEAPRRPSLCLSHPGVCEACRFMEGLPSGKPEDLATEAGAMAFFRDHQRFAETILLNRGEFRPMAFIIGTEYGPEAIVGEKLWDNGTQPPPPGTPFIAAIGCGVEFDNEGKSFFAHQLRSACHSLKAIGVAFFSEIWRAPPMVAEAREWAQQERAKMAPDLKDEPGRTEHLMGVMQHRSLKGHVLAFAEISRDENGKPTLAPWVEDPNLGMSGRFTNMLVPLNEVDAVAYIRELPGGEEILARVPCVACKKALLRCRCEAPNPGGLLERALDIIVNEVNS